MPSKLPLPVPARDDMAPSDHEEAATNGADQAEKPLNGSAQKRRKARRAKDPVVGLTEDTEPTDGQVEVNGQVEVIEPVEMNEPVETAGAEPEGQGNGATKRSAGTERLADEPAKPEASAVVTPSVRSKKGASTQPAAKPKKGFLRRLLRLLVLLVVVGGLAAAAYLIWPTINSRYIQPVETTAADLSTVQGRLGDIDTRLEGLESATTELDTSAAASEARLDGAEAGQVLVMERLDDLEDQIERQTLRIANLDELASTLGSDQELANSIAAQQVEVTRAAERMSRARLFLYQANYGLAATDLRAARETLSSIDVGADSEYSEVIERLDRAIANLPEFPVSAAGDLDIAWEALLAGQEGEGPAPASAVDGPDSAGVEPDPESSEG